MITDIKPTGYNVAIEIIGKDKYPDSSKLIKTKSNVELSLDEMELEGYILGIVRGIGPSAYGELYDRYPELRANIGDFVIVYKYLFPMKFLDVPILGSMQEKILDYSGISLMIVPDTNVVPIENPFPSSSEVE